MGVLTLAGLCDRALQESGFVKFSAYVGSSAAGALQMLALAEGAGQRMVMDQWQRLVVRGTQALTTGTEAYAVPSGFGWYVPDTMLTNGSYINSFIPTPPESWAVLKSTGQSGREYRCRFFADQLQVLQATTGDTLAFEYIDNRPWINGSTRKVRPTADADVWLLDDELALLDIKWRLQQAKGMPIWGATRAEFESRRNHRLGIESGAQTLVERGSEEYQPRAPLTSLWVQ